MGDREKNIIEAAIRVFMRYGVRRSTMNDIAAEAGLVRQTLYTVYASKDEVLCAVIRHMSDRALAAMEERWATAKDLAEKLDIYFEEGIVNAFRMIRAQPDSDDVVTGYNEAGKAEIACMSARKVEALAGILAPYEARIAAAGLGVDQLAEFIQSASSSFKYSARDETHLRSQLAALKATVLSLAGT